MNTTFMPAIAPHWRARSNYASNADWLVNIYNRVLRRTPQLPLPGRRKIVPVRLKNRRHPFLVRLGATDLFVLDEMFQTREYSFVEECLSDVRRIVDLGANVGFSLRYWNEVFSEAKILAVEPDPENVRLCRANVDAAGFADQVTLIQACIGSRARQVTLGGSDEWTYHMTDCSDAGVATTRVVTLSELLDTHFRSDSIDLLKCDIEGAERELFSDCTSWISRVKAIVVELHPPYSVSEFLGDMDRSGAKFELVRNYSNKLCPVLLLRSRSL